MFDFQRRFCTASQTSKSRSSRKLKFDVLLLRYRALGVTNAGARTVPKKSTLPFKGWVGGIAVIIGGSS